MDLIERDITCEMWREYDFNGRTYRIEKPQKLYYYKGSTTHRVTTSDGVAHCVPVPGLNGCVLRWKNYAKKRKVNF